MNNKRKATLDNEEGMYAKKRKVLSRRESVKEEVREEIKESKEPLSMKEGNFSPHYILICEGEKYSFHEALIYNYGKLSERMGFLHILPFHPVMSSDLAVDFLGIWAFFASQGLIQLPDFGINDLNEHWVFLCLFINLRGERETVLYIDLQLIHGKALIEIHHPFFILLFGSG